MGNNIKIKNMKYSFVIAALVGAMTQVDLAEATAVSRHHRRHHHHQFVQDDDKAEAKVVKEFKEKLGKAKAKKAAKDAEKAAEEKKAKKENPEKKKVNDELWTANMPEKYFGMTHVDMRNTESDSESDSDDE